MSSEQQNVKDLTRVKHKTTKDTGAIPKQKSDLSQATDLIQIDAIPKQKSDVSQSTDLMQIDTPSNQIDKNNLNPVKMVKTPTYSKPIVLSHTNTPQMLPQAMEISSLQYTPPLQYTQSSALQYTQPSTIDYTQPSPVR